jgi:signal transduction histidine kinase
MDQVEAIVQARTDELLQANQALRTALRQEQETAAELQRQLRLAGSRRQELTELRRIKEELRQARRRDQEFLATLAHELRNPLTPIRNSLHILRLAGYRNDAVGRARDMMERQVNNMVRLVNDLMEISRITRGKIELRKEPVELARVIQSALETSKPLIDAGNHQLILNLPPEPILLCADPVRLAQALANVINNAAAYTDHGGRIELTVSRQGKTVAISIRDNGSGIAPDLLPKIFDLFTQGARAAGDPKGGLGVGLTLVRSLVELHGGTVSASSAGPGLGSEFLVLLPLEDQTHSRSPNRRRQRQSR